MSGSRRPSDIKRMNQLEMQRAMGSQHMDKASGSSRWWLRGGTLAAIALVATGCAVTPQPISVEAQRTQLAEDRQQVMARQEAVQGPIGLEEAIARALKYNLDARVTLMEAAMRRGQLDLTRYDMLPKLAAGAGWTHRSEDNLAISRNTVTGVRSTDPFVSQDRSRETADLTLSWNVLDFGVSYLQAQQNADELLIAEQRKRRMSNQIIQQVRSAYWRAASAEPLAREVEPLLKDAYKALDDARATEKQRLVAPLESLNYQRGLLEVIRNLEQLQRDLTVARLELAALMGLPPGTPFTLAAMPTDSWTLPKLDMAVENMEELALDNRPELREEMYQKRITALESRKALLRLLPGISLNTGVNYDSNSYLVHNNWYDVGFRVSWNLLNLASRPATKQLNEAREALAQARREALAMAVLAQVRIGHQEFLRKRHAFEQTRELNAVEQRIYGHLRNMSAATTRSPLQQIQSRLTALFSEASQHRAYAELQMATASLFMSMGLDPVPTEVASHDLETMKRAVGEVLTQWNSGDVAALQRASTGGAR